MSIFPSGRMFELFSVEYLLIIILFNTFYMKFHDYLYTIMYMYAHKTVFLFQKFVAKTENKAQYIICELNKLYLTWKLI